MVLGFTGKMGDMKVAMVDDDDDEVVAVATGPVDMVVAVGVCIEGGIGDASTLLTGRGEGELRDCMGLDMDCIICR